MSNLLQKIASFDKPFGDTLGRKEALTQASESYKQALDEKLADLKEDASRVGKQALVIGGAIAAVYLLLELLLPDDEEEVQMMANRPVIIERKNSESWLGKTITSVAVTALLAIAKQKLEDFLVTQTETNATENTNTTAES